MRIGIVTKDTLWKERWQKAVQNREGSILILSFPTYEKACIAAGEKQIERILCDPEPMREPDDLCKFCPTVFLVNTMEEETVEQEYSCYCRYHSISEWIESFRVKGGHPSVYSKCRSLQVFLSGGGGAGTTSAAIAFAIYCRKKLRMHPLYLNFERNNSTDTFLQGDSLYGLDDCLFAVRNGKYDTAAVIRSSLIKDPTGVLFLAPCRRVEDSWEVTGEEMMRLCDAVEQEGLADIILLDLSGRMEKEIVLPVLSAESVVLVADGEQTNNDKTRNLLRVLPRITGCAEEDLLEKEYLLYNRFRRDGGEIMKDLPIEKLGGIHMRNRTDPRELVRELSELEVFERLGAALHV